MLQNQSLLGIAFFEATAFVILMVLLMLLRRDHATTSFRLWLAGWACLTVSGIAEVLLLLQVVPGAGLVHLAALLAAQVLFLGAAQEMTAGVSRHTWQILPLAGVTVLALMYLERPGFGAAQNLHWATAAFLSGLCLYTARVLWRVERTFRGHGRQFLAALFTLAGLHGMDRPLWPQNPIYHLRIAFDHLLGLCLGIGMVVMYLEEARARTEKLNDKLRRLTLLTASSSRTWSVQEVLDEVLRHLMESLGAKLGLVRLLEGEGQNVELVLRASVGYGVAYVAEQERVPVTEPWSQRVLNEGFTFQAIDEVKDLKTRQQMGQKGVRQLVTLSLRGKEGPLGIIVLGLSRGGKFQQEEIAYLVNVANLLGLTLQNVNLFEEVATMQRHWAYTFDSIGDPILVHDREHRIVRSNRRLAQLLGREVAGLEGRNVNEVFLRKGTNFHDCPYCEGVAGEGEDVDPWLGGYFLVSNSSFSDPAGKQLGTVHVLKDITERKRAEEKYRNLISSVQEGVFISTPQGRFLDFNQAFQNMTGYESREELLGVNIPSLYVNPSDRERLRKLLQEHGSVSDFEFEVRRKDGEVRTMTESSIAVRDASGNVTAYQGFLLDITERKRAEQEIRRRNRELLVLNSIGQTLNESLVLADSLNRTLRQMAELFSLDAASVYLFEKEGTVLRRVAAIGHRSEYARHFPRTQVSAELLHHIQTLRATILTVQGLPLPAVFRDAQRKEGIETAYFVILWSKEKIIGGLVVGSRTPREFSPADMNLLIAVGAQISSAIDRTLLFDETRQAYENLRRTQEQLLHSEKMAAVGQLISGVAHELNNPLTAILGYSQLLTASGQAGPQAMEYADKLYKQAQRTHRIVQNLLSFARQHRPERTAVRLNQVLEDTLALRDYDLRVNNIRVHRDLEPNLPVTAADPHQLQQVFLNIVNNAADAILEHTTEGDIWVRTGAGDGHLFVEFSDSGPGVQDASRVFDPFYTTKPVGKGTGLGLSICYGIITEHGGTIRVKNTPPRGATFTIELPVQAAEKGETPLDAQKVPAVHGGQILLVDDDDSVLEAVGEILRGRRHQVVTAQSSEQAAGLLSEREFDVVVADLHLSGGRNGLGLYEWITAKRPLLLHRVVLMSSGASPGTQLEACRASGCRILQKPFKASELVAAVEDALGPMPSPTLHR